MSTTPDIDPAVHPQFIDPEHDIVLQARDAVRMEDGRLKPESLFQMRKVYLAAASPVFRDMVEAAEQEGKDVPLLLSESAAILEGLLAFVLQDVDALPDLESSTLDYDVMLGLWEASIKYGMAIPQATLEYHLGRRLTLPDCREYISVLVERCVTVLVAARKHNRDKLCVKAAKALATLHYSYYESQATALAAEDMCRLLKYRDRYWKSKYDHVCSMLQTEQRQKARAYEPVL